MCFHGHTNLALYLNQLFETVPEIAVVAEQSASARESQLKVTSCAACSRAFSDEVECVVLSRCKHSLCFECALRCVADSNSVAGANGLSVASMRSQPMCVVRRCRAPVSEADALNCLAPLKVDECCQSAIEAFNLWSEQDEPAGAVAGPTHIVFPEFTPDMASEAMEGDGKDNEDELCGDDFEGAYGLLWLWDKDYVDEVGRCTGRWMCAACGAYHQPSSLTPLTDADAIDDALDMEIVIPDHPMHPHCASARAYAV